MFKRVKSVFKKDGKGKEPKEPKPPKEKRRGFLRKRGGRVAESEVLPPAHDSFIPPSHDGGSAYHHPQGGSYAGSIISNDHALLMPPGANSAAPTLLVAPPTTGGGSTIGQRSLAPHEGVSLHDFPRISRAPSMGETHVSRTTGRHLSGPSISRGRPSSRMSAESHGSFAGSEDGPPLPVPPRVPTNASRMTRGDAGMYNVPVVPSAPRTNRTNGGRPMRSRSASDSRSRSGERRPDRAQGSMRSRAGRPPTRGAAPPGQVREFDYAYPSGAPRSLTGSDDRQGRALSRGFGDMDPSGLFRRIKNLYSLEHPDFGFSRCTGNKKAVCIGINYIGTPHALDGCIADAKRMYRLLTNLYKFPRDQIMVLTDDADERNQPTRKNILSALNWLASGASPHDSLFIHYSGHGGQIQDRDGDEVDGLDEMIFPVDYQENGIILDDEIHSTLVKPLPPACRLTAVFDSCHSGSIMDLVYLYHSDGRIMGTDVTPKFKELKMTPAEVICWSGSSDSGSSADANINGLQVGAMSYAFVKTLKANPRISFADLLRDLRQHTKKYHQRPQLSASHRINVMRTFKM